ncbi:hypothetical protein COLO4_10674 [Corchorus olitorius]|uniref:Uncharacterized protein n=1 Tax=Corchorus olitorius TaxID=93759 RepID=A0A1R3K7E4_9ROSI|nr:hypothetical protein COLO4_10674 [Corchorus olitorius]
MAALQCFNNDTEKGLMSQGYGGKNGWACKPTKYQGAPNGYTTAYSESESYSQVQYGYGMNESQAAYGKVGCRDGYGQSYGGHKAQNGNALASHGFGGHLVNGMAPIQGYGSGNHASPGKGQNHGNGYGSTHGNQMNGYGSNHGNKMNGYGSTHGNHRNNGGIGHGGFGNHTNYETSESHYEYEEFETHNSGYTNNRMPQIHHGNRPGRPGQGTVMMKPQAYSPGGRNMNYEITETTESHYSEESYFYGGKPSKSEAVRGLLRKIKDGISGNGSCSDDSDSEFDEYGRRRVWKGKGL